MYQNFDLIYCPKIVFTTWNMSLACLSYISYPISILYLYIYIYICRHTKFIIKENVYAYIIIYVYISVSSYVYIYIHNLTILSPYMTNWRYVDSGIASFSSSQCKLFWFHVLLKVSSKALFLVIRLVLQWPPTTYFAENFKQKHSPQNSFSKGSAKYFAGYRYFY